MRRKRKIKTQEESLSERSKVERVVWNWIDQILGILEVGLSRQVWTCAKREFSEGAHRFSQ